MSILVRRDTTPLVLRMLLRTLLRRAFYKGVESLWVFLLWGEGGGTGARSFAMLPIVG